MFALLRFSSEMPYLAFHRQSMVSVSADCRPLYWLRYLPIVGQCVDHHSATILVDTSVDKSTNTSRSTYRPTLDRYVDRHISRHSADMSTEMSTDPIPIPNLTDPPIPIPNPIDPLTLSLDLAPPLIFLFSFFFFFLFELQTSDFEVHLHLHYATQAVVANLLIFVALISYWSQTHPSPLTQINLV